MYNIMNIYIYSIGISIFNLDHKYKQHIKTMVEHAQNTMCWLKPVILFGNWG